MTHTNAPSPCAVSHAVKFNLLDTYPLVARQAALHDALDPAIAVYVFHLYPVMIVVLVRVSGASQRLNHVLRRIPLLPYCANIVAYWPNLAVFQRELGHACTQCSIDGFFYVGLVKYVIKVFSARLPYVSRQPRKLLHIDGVV